MLNPLYVWIAAAVLIVGGFGTAGYSLYHMGQSDSVKTQTVAQKKHEKKRAKEDAKIDRNTPFNADRDAKLKWLQGHAVSQ